MVPQRSRTGSGLPDSPVQIRLSQRRGGFGFALESSGKKNSCSLKPFICETMLQPKTHPTWHQGAVPPDSLVWRNQMKRIRNLHRSVSTPHDSPSNTLPYKKRSYNDGGSNVATHPAGAEPSPGRRLMRHFHFNFPNIASRFTVTPARDDPLASPRRQSKNQSKHVNELHEMIP